MTDQEKLDNWKRETVPDWIPSRVRLPANIYVCGFDVSAGDYAAHCTMFGRVSIAVAQRGIFPLKNSEFEVLEFRSNMQKQIAKQERQS